jgi:hypothetical protein
MTGDRYSPAVVFGQGNKLRAEGPYLDVLQAFRRELAGVERLVVVGYSFRDEHVNHYVTQWFNERVSRKLTIVDPSFSSNGTPYAQSLRRLSSKSSRVEIIERAASEALAQFS